MRKHEKHRDSEKRLFLLTAILILLSVVFLTGSLIVLAEFPRSEQPYEAGQFNDEGIFTRKEPSQTSETQTGAEGVPLSQREMQEKFAALTVTDEAANAVTVVGEDALHAYWADYNPATEGIRSLTQAEVFYLLADSVRLYETGETLVLPAYDLPTRPEKELATRFSSDRVLTKSGDLRTDTEAVYNETLLFYCPQEAVGRGHETLVREISTVYGVSAEYPFNFFSLYEMFTQYRVPSVLFYQAVGRGMTRLYPSDETFNRLTDR